MPCRLSAPDTGLSKLCVLRTRDHGAMEAEVEGRSGRRHPFVKERESLCFRNVLFMSSRKLDRRSSQVNKTVRISRKESSPRVQSHFLDGTKKSEFISRTFPPVHGEDLAVAFNTIVASMSR